MELITVDHLFTLSNSFTQHMSYTYVSLTEAWLPYKISMNF